MGLRRRQRITGLVIAATLLGPALWLGLGLIPPPLLVNRGDTSYAVTDRNGNLLRLSLSSDEKYRLWTPLAELPEALQEATLHYEDRWFYRHPGVNPVALARAAWTSFAAHGRWMGASTLTMQLARQRWRLRTGTLSGKLRQIGYALWLERHFSKQELLEAYLNLAPYGANIEGAGAAAWVYFRKSAGQLNNDEARALALIPQNPARRSPFTAHGKRALQQAWRTVYGDDPGFGRLWFRRREDLPLRAPHFAERLHELFYGASTLHSTLDPTAQGLTEDLLRSFIRQHRAQGIVNAAAMVIHAPTMEVLAYVGSADYLDRGIRGYVNGLKARRSPGSTLKPFIYALAIDQGLITPDTLLKDTPLWVGDYQPENFERNFYGPLSATDALVRSRNIPAIALMDRLQRPTLFQFLQRAGLRLPADEARYGLTLAMGGAEVSMEELLGLYGLLANGGEWRSPSWLGNPREQKSAPKASLLLSAEAAFLVREMLEANPPPQRSFGVRSFGRGRPVAWKTGTSSGLKDAWAVGLAGDLLAGVWLGNFDGTPNRHLVGRELAGPLLFGILEAIGLERPATQPRPLPPEALKRVEICPVSGALRSPWCPHGRTGWIIPGVSPLRPCTVHRQIHADPASGLRLCRGDEGRGEPRVAEFWDGDELELFRLAGVRRNLPPPFERPCEDPAGSDAGTQPPRILSPRPGVSYPVGAANNKLIEFSAVASGGRHRLFWFVDDVYVGEGGTLGWTGKAGDHLVRVVDEQGQSASATLLAVPAQ
ncbi:penicillin-binding protein 1C [Methylococcus mesophilus]|uniref:penicillin-binding protein 1C n=1 Tax=Methylococcus mesophilus TaxID=2993564 RepID=UPI00224B5A12|nr:penicillin-binding protein 1C [Methylococcus mesophilus]UZR27341.1 penicillin-binding protein 1C [Methylococcus mesophilus]